MVPFSFLPPKLKGWLPQDVVSHHLPTSGRSAHFCCAKVGHEIVNERLKEFCMFCLPCGFRHDLATHNQRFHAIANILKISLETEEHLLFSIRDMLHDFNMQYYEEEAVGCQG